MKGERRNQRKEKGMSAKRGEEWKPKPHNQEGEEWWGRMKKKRREQENEERVFRKISQWIRRRRKHEAHEMSREDDVDPKKHSEGKRNKDPWQKPPLTLVPNSYRTHTSAYNHRAYYRHGYLIHICRKISGLTLTHAVHDMCKKGLIITSNRHRLSLIISSSIHNGFLSLPSILIDACDHNTHKDRHRQR